jgi:hypothetical protein
MASHCHVHVRVLVTSREHIVAAVLELDIPMFQILGTPCTEARRLVKEVIVTQTIYERIFSAKFLLREGPQFDTGKRIVNTSVVEGYNE